MSERLVDLGITGHFLKNRVDSGSHCGTRTWEFHSSQRHPQIYFTESVITSFFVVVKSGYDDSFHTSAGKKKSSNVTISSLSRNSSSFYQECRKKAAATSSCLGRQLVFSMLPTPLLSFIFWRKSKMAAQINSSEKSLQVMQLHT